MPATTVAAIIEKNGKLLLIKRSIKPFKGMWELPGGYIEINEKAKNAVIREIKEETNLNIQPKFLFYNDEILSNIKHHNVLLVFHAKANGKVKINEESSEFKFFTFKKALKLKLAFRHNEVIRKWMQLKL